ncbi:hypothetical protein ACFE04_013107 [Oxalis oulophora]
MSGFSMNNGNANSNPQLYACQRCPLVFTSIERFVMHYETHIPVELNVSPMMRVVNNTQYNSNYLAHNNHLMQAHRLLRPPQQMPQNMHQIPRPPQQMPQNIQSNMNAVQSNMMGRPWWRNAPTPEPNMAYAIPQGRPIRQTEVLFPLHPTPRQPNEFPTMIDLVDDGDERRNDELDLSLGL